VKILKETGGTGTGLFEQQYLIFVGYRGE